MKHTFLAILAAGILLCACNTPRIDSHEAAAETIGLQNGDLILLSLCGSYELEMDSASVAQSMEPLRTAAACQASANAAEIPERMRGNVGCIDSAGNTAQTMIHVSMVERSNDSLYIIDATLKRGIARYPIEDFLADFTLADGKLPVVYVARIADSAEAAAAVANAKRHIGKHFDTDFNYDDSTMYCSELVQKCYRHADGSPIVAETAVDFRNSDSLLAVYWKQIFTLIARPVPNGCRGILPQDIYNFVLNKSRQAE